MAICVAAYAIPGSQHESCWAHWRAEWGSNKLGLKTQNITSSPTNLQFEASTSNEDLRDSLALISPPLTPPVRKFIFNFDAEQFFFFKLQFKLGFNFSVVADFFLFFDAETWPRILPRLFFFFSKLAINKKIHSWPPFPVWLVLICCTFLKKEHAIDSILKSSH